MELFLSGGMIGTTANVFRKPVATSTVNERVNSVHVITRFVDVIRFDPPGRLGNFLVGIQVVFHNATQVMIAILTHGTHSFIIMSAVSEGESIRPPLEAELHQL